MNELFELFTYRLIERLVAPAPCRVRYQQGTGAIIRNASTGETFSRIVPDILLEWEEGGNPVRLPIDAKYKLYDQRRLDPGDIYQVCLYSFAYGDGSRAPDRALLVFPATNGFTSDALDVQRPGETPRSRIDGVGVPVERALSELRDGSGPVMNALAQLLAPETTWRARHEPAIPADRAGARAEVS